MDKAQLAHGGLHLDDDDAHLHQQQGRGAAPAYTALDTATATAPNTPARRISLTRKLTPSLDTAAQHKPLPIPYLPPSAAAHRLSMAAPASSYAAYPPPQQEILPNPHTTSTGQHDYTHAYDGLVTHNGNGHLTGAAHAEDDERAPTPIPATGPTKGVGVPSTYNAFVAFPLLAPWYPSTAKASAYHDPNVSGPKSYPPPLATRGLTEARFMQIHHYACSIRADSQRNKGLLCCGLGILLGGLGCVLIDNKCVNNKPLRDQVNRWAFENVNPRLEHDGIDVRFAYQKGALRAYFKDA